MRATDERAGAIFFAAMRDLVGPDLAAHPRFESNVRQLGLTLYGMALTDHLRPASAAKGLAIELRSVARRLFDV